MPIGGNQIYTITPNNGYPSPTSWWTTSPWAPSERSYTFTDVTANHTITATFATNEPTSLALPAITGAYNAGANLSVSWTANVATGGGEYFVWATSASGWYYLKTVPASGSANYSTQAPLNIPIATAYNIVVGYRSTVGSGTFTAFGTSSGTFDVLGLSSIAVTGPTGSQLAGAALPISWTASSTVTTGEFGVWATNSSGWTFLTSVPANGASPTIRSRRRTSPSVPATTSLSATGRLPAVVRGPHGVRARHV